MPNEKLIHSIKKHMDMLQSSGRSTAEWIEILRRTYDDKLTNQDRKRISNELH